MYVVFLLCSFHIQLFKYYSNIYDINNIIPTNINTYMQVKNILKELKGEVENSEE